MITKVKNLFVLCLFFINFILIINTSNSSSLKSKSSSSNRFNRHNDHDTIIYNINQFAVRVKGGISTARRLAQKFNLKLVKQVSFYFI
jgi:hypothetical protein